MRFSATISLRPSFGNSTYQTELNSSNNSRQSPSPLTMTQQTNADKTGTVSSSANRTTQSSVPQLVHSDSFRQTVSTNSTRLRRYCKAFYDRVMRERRRKRGSEGHFDDLRIYESGLGTRILHTPDVEDATDAVYNSALKFRYQLAFSGTKSSKVTIRFDEKIIAQKGAGWEEMLEGALRGWVECVVLECRGEREE